LIVPKYVLDTNVYIDAFRGQEKAEDLKRFLTKHLPLTYLSSVVTMELRTGARTKQQAESLETEVFGPFEKRHRLFAPSANAFKEAGRILAALTKEGLFDLHAPNNSLIRDSLLAASCREHGFVLITNDADYQAIKRHLKAFRYVAPWP
jgi:predicted nucleic acid-binding protein